MKFVIRCAPPNSIFVLEDVRGGKSPEIEMIEPAIWATRSCIIVGSLCFMDGETELAVSDLPDDALAAAPAFDGVLDTPNRIFRVSTSEEDVLLRLPVPGHFTRVRVWTDHPKWPDHILVVLG